MAWLLIVQGKIFALGISQIKAAAFTGGFGEKGLGGYICSIQHAMSEKKLNNYE